MLSLLCRAAAWLLSCAAPGKAGPGTSRAFARPASAALALLLAAGAAHAAITITDDRGRTLHFERPPERVVSLLPSSTESLCEMQQCHRLVGVDRYSNWPASVQALPRVGGGLDPNIEAIVALRPDVVLLSTASRVSDRLEALGVKVVALEPKTHADVRRILATIGDLFAVPRAEGVDRVWRVIDASVQAAAQSLPPAARGARVYFEVSRGPYVAGQHSFIGETLARLGVRNVVPAELGPFPRLSPEFVLRARPDLVMVSNRSGQPRATYPGWNNLAAIQAGRLCVFGPEQADVLVRPGPRMAEAARIMARCLGEKFSAP
ncbi:iron complex transport system substrate-binding protein [Oryzisolibacter propanilivorax]|uniref:Iron complex transport system substrate-binding protein n=1 Tax=Oryzisolibacter propanilivorax TaxID=1527607 RepID=A0A1G9PDX9_9BURK|nr:helical backbone metal receptor [Oryzisolibacter propanilivorax]SDL96691.1 iron complex transport system substrate-binding protein [Oryzisolibacter propanilivorax]